MVDVMPSDWPLSYFASVYSQIATKPYVTPKQIVTEADLSSMFSLFISISRPKLAVGKLFGRNR